MTPNERATLETQADRARRRGELSTALEIFQRLCAAFPTDPALARKLQQLSENLQPMELTSAKSRFVPEAPSPGGAPLDDAEALAARGDYPGAISAYRKALAEKPDSEMLRERLTELFALMRAHSPRASAPRPQKTPESVLAELLDRIASRRKP